MKYCVDCGQALPDAAKFCSKCGVEQPQIRVAAEVDADCGEQGHTVYLNIIRKKDGSVALDKESVAKMSGMFMEKLALFVNGVMQGAFHKRGLFLETMTTEDGFEVLTHESEVELIMFFNKDQNGEFNGGPGAALSWYGEPKLDAAITAHTIGFQQFLLINNRFATTCTTIYAQAHNLDPDTNFLEEFIDRINKTLESKEKEILIEKENQFINDLASKIVDTEAFKNAVKNNTSNFDVENLTQAILQGFVKNGIISDEILNNLNEILSENVKKKKLLQKKRTNLLTILHQRSLILKHSKMP